MRFKRSKPSLFFPTLSHNIKTLWKRTLKQAGILIVVTGDGSSLWLLDLEKDALQYCPGNVSWEKMPNSS